MKTDDSLRSASSPLAARLLARTLKSLPLVAICALLPSPLRAQATLTGLGFFGG
jgi:hypothetical protein